MVCFLTGYASCAASASLPAWPAHRKARSAPRAHVRELLCVSQSSKERLRRSRTESSGAAPAIEELPGTARQCKARRAACGEAGNTVQFSHGRGGLEGARPSSSREHQILAEVRIPLPFRARTAEVGNFRSGFALAHPKKSEISVPVPFSSLAKRSGGRLALRLPRPSFPRGRSAFRPNPDHMLQGGKEKKRRTGNSDATPLIRWGGTPLRLSPA